MVKARILIVEDEILIARSLQVKLEEQGYSICAASSGEEAIQKTEEEKLDLVLMDIMLNGDMDGIEAANQIRSCLDIPVIYLTAYSDQDVLDRAKMTGPFGYLLKPFEDRELYANIEMALYKAKMEAKLRSSEEELRKYQLHLEDLVKERTYELMLANEQLKQEITERKKAEEELRESEAKYAALVEQSKCGVLVVQDEVYKFVNRAMVDVTGYEIEELVGKHFLDMVVADCRNFIAQIHTSHMAGQEVPSFYEAKFQCRNGTVKDVELSATTIKYNGKPAEMLIIRDVTEHKKREKELQKIEKLEAIGILAGGIAHDFNNMLAAITGNISLAELYLNSGGNVFEVLKRTEKASQQATELTQQLLTFSKGGSPIKKPASISQLLKDTAGFALRGSRVGYQFSIPDNLWAVEVDTGQISQVINNLIINASQAMPEGGIIELYAENTIVGVHDGLPLKEGKYVKISVKDHGVGIPPKYFTNIFEPYFTTKKEGSGLGLAISYSIIKHHEGHIMVESEVEVGTVFHIYLPASEKEVFIIEDIIEEVPLSGRGKILLMDDKKSIRDMVGNMLTYLGYEVEVAADGTEAVELYKKARESGEFLAAVILDLTVPGGMGGKEAVQKLHEIDTEVRAIVSSGYSNDPVIAEYKKYGFSGVVVKPYGIKELGKVLHKVITESGESCLNVQGEKSEDNI